MFDQRFRRFSLLLLLNALFLGVSSFANTGVTGAIGAQFSDPPTDQEIFGCHYFSEPLNPTGATNAAENQALIDALKSFSTRSNADDFSALTDFLKANPDTAWRASLLLNLGIAYKEAGFFTRAMKSFREGWQLTKKETKGAIKGVADCLVGQLMDIQSKLGMEQDLDVLAKEIDGREIAGSAHQNVVSAQDNLRFMRNFPDHAFRCGAFALDNVKRAKANTLRHDLKLLDAEPTSKGYSLKQLKALAKASGLNERIVKRREGAVFPDQMTVHWKAGHFSMVVEHQGTRYRLRDPNFGHDIWVSQAALEEETSGYGLIEDKGTLPAGLDPVSDAEGDQIWGGCHTGTQDPDDTNPCDKKAGLAGAGEGGCSSCNIGMPGYAIHLMLVSLNITDTPVSYTPPRGPAIDITLSYNQRDANQPTTGFAYTNFGPLWTFNWMSYVIDNPTSPAGTVKVYSRGGGARPFNFSTSPYSQSDPQFTDKSILKRVTTSPAVYERDYPDGSKELFEVSDNATTYPRKIFLTKVIDPQGNTVQVNYDSSLRITSIVDAVNQATTLSYDFGGGWNNLVTKITDPFGRTTQFQYWASVGGQYIVTGITDAAGMQSTFQYDGSGFMQYLFTPYGTTAFAHGESGTVGNQTIARWLTATDPLGGTERVEYRQDYMLPSSQSSANAAANYETAPTGMDTGANGVLGSRNTFYWSKKAMMDAPPTLSGGFATTFASAHIYNWLHDGYNTDMITGVLGSEKAPLESRVWYNYPGQYGENAGNSGNSGSAQVIKKGRVLDDGSTQLYTYTYNSLGNITKETSPAPYNRSTSYAYYANGIDLQQIRQTTSNSSGTVNDLLASYGTYFTDGGGNSLHVPLTMTDAAGQTTTYTYYSNGQKHTQAVTRNSATETTIWNYTGNYLTSMAGPVAGATTSYGYDTFGRVKTITDSDGYILNSAYDALNRPTTTTYPNGTWTQTTYDRLDPAWQKDRLGRWTHRVYDALRRLASVTDPESHTVQYDWCACGSLKGIIDANNNRTSFMQDIQGRVTTKTYADNSTFTSTYETTTSRLKSTLDAKSQTTTYAYNADDTLGSVTYSGAQYATPNVSFTYSPFYERVATMTDGTGQTQYAYKPAGSLGANRLDTIDGPWANDPVSYTYDELGQILTAKVNGIGNTVTYDALRRVATAANPLGSFTYHYVNQTARLGSTDRPGGQSVVYSYYGNPGDERLSEIRNLGPSASLVSKFNYTYNAVGDILNWTQQAGTGNAQYYELGYDKADQLLSAPLKDVATKAMVTPYTYRYDAAGNRTNEQVDNTVSTSGYNNLNQLKTIGGGGALTLEGTVSEPSTVTVGGVAVPVNVNNRFKATVQTANGSNSIPITAKDGSGNTTSKTAQITVNVTARTLSYDNNGNLADDGVKTYEWDAANRLLAINYTGTSNRTEFAYDGQSRRVQIVEKASGTVTSTKKFVWIGNAPAEERDAGNAVTKRFFAEGEQIGANSYLFNKDHLGSIREMVNADNTGLIRARYSYDPYGRRTKVSGDLEADFGFTGHYYHAPSTLHLTLYRAYDANKGRWLSRDPLGNAGGPNLYEYVLNNPVMYWDPLGLKQCWKRVCMTSFGDLSSDNVGTRNNKLKRGDIAVGHYGSGQFPKKGDQWALPFGTCVGVFPNNSSPYTGTVADVGAYDKKHPDKAGPGDWIDRWDPDRSRRGESDNGWINFDVPDSCPCPNGSNQYPNGAPGLGPNPGTMTG